MKTTIEERVFRMIERELGASRVDAATRFSQDLGVDSLELIVFSLKLADEFDLPPISVGDTRNFLTVQDVINYIKPRLKTGQNAPNGQDQPTKAGGSPDRPRKGLTAWLSGR